MVDALVDAHLCLLLVRQCAQVEAHGVELLLHLGEDGWCQVSTFISNFDFYYLVMPSF